MKHFSWKTILAGVALSLTTTGAALADRAPVGPDFEQARPARTDLDRELAASDGEKPIPPGEQLLFALDSAALTPAARDELAQVARWMRAHPDQRVVLEGHTDASGSAAYNTELAGRRAAAVRDALVQMGVPARRLTVLVYGESKATASAASINRRVVVYPAEHAVLDVGPRTARR